MGYIDRFKPAPEPAAEPDAVSVIVPLCRFCGREIAAGKRLHDWCERVTARGRAFKSELTRAER